VCAPPFPGMASQTLVARGALSPRWSRDTRELRFFQGDQVMSNALCLTRGFIEWSPLERFFTVPQAGVLRLVGFEVAVDGKRLLMVPQPRQAGDSQAQQV
jgi:hypothetical protein